MSLAQPAVLLDRVDAEADDLDVALVELGLELGHVAELGRADRREVLGVREQDAPGVAEPLVEADVAFGGFGLEVGGGVADAKRHLILLRETVRELTTVQLGNLCSASVPRPPAFVTAFRAAAGARC